MGKKSQMWKAAKFIGTLLATLGIAATVLVMIADNFFVTHAVAKAQHEMMRDETRIRLEKVEQKEDLHYREVTRRLDEIGDRVERIYNVVVEEKKKK